MGRSPVTGRSVDGRRKNGPEAARVYADTRLMPRVQRAFQDELFDRDIYAEMGAQGIFGRDAERLWLRRCQSGRLWFDCRELERVDSAYRSAFSVQSSLVMQAIYAYGSEAQRSQYLPKLALGEWIGAFWFDGSKSWFGPRNMQARARAISGGYC